MSSLLSQGLFIALGLVGQVATDGPPDEEARQRDEVRLKAIHAAADAYKLYAGSERKQELVRSPQPVLRFDDTVTLSLQSMSGPMTRSVRWRSPRSSFGPTALASKSSSRW